MSVRSLEIIFPVQKLMQNTDFETNCFPSNTPEMSINHENISVV